MGYSTGKQGQLALRVIEPEQYCDYTRFKAKVFELFESG